ncbi:uncharacterized protein EDB91DRAFT_1348200 [Suillus paluster]|uniref:uncharacterized protein n=1 Tax=Suillus paluster TaxID=48578 RepID=UPI001B87265A|nr:uncharacterized protein EDB91DRAFT_1348200 [Suillus paluster]KAG1735673.1 hypothetical protein EDB91DRAFT_1348200 [Suillus paluster]
MMCREDHLVGRGGVLVLIAMTLMNSCNTHKAQIVSSGLGQHFVSPRKARDKRKTQVLVKLPGAELKRRRLLSQMQRLMDPTSSKPGRSLGTTLEGPSGEADNINLTNDFDFAGAEVETAHAVSSDRPADSETSPSKRRTLPDKSTGTLYANWKKLIPTLVDPQLKYYARTLGQALETTHNVISACGTLSCAQRRTSILCLFFDRFISIDVLSCECSSLPQVLLHHGLFPTAPSQPRMAVSVDLLSFYRALFERSCDAINALASALKTHYLCRGFQVTDSHGDIVQEPFCRGLGYAVQWYDVLQVEIERQVDAVLKQSRDLVAGLQSPQPLALAHAEHSAEIGLHHACFGGALFGRPVDQGGDIHVATDGNFHHRHRRSAGDCPPFYEPTYFLPKGFVDAVGRRIHTQRKRPAKVHTPLVPDKAIDLCENAYEAADGKKQKAAMDSFDDTGLMALICRHDIPLFFVNIDSPGEQQKYPIALIENLFTLLPPQATVVTLYDVGCVLARTLSKFEILPKDTLSRLRFMTTAMHAYGHEWACQLAYNPRVERSSSRQRRIWLIDRQATAIGSEMKSDLGDWLKRCLKRGVKDQGSAALDVINRSETSVEDLQAQWADQRQSQLSIRAHAPTRLKKELDTVLTLQADLDVSDRALQATKTMLEKEAASDDTLDVLESLQRGHDRLMTKVEALYASLNVNDRFPELDGINLNFVHVLLMARDLKMNIRKCAITSFFEWDKLDRAVGGSHQTLAKCQPALMMAIRKFNSYCERLESLYDPTWTIPLPTPLPTKLAELRGDQTLMQDVWVTPSMGDVPCWLEDADIRDGIRALLKRDRCQEEQKRLGMEADNLCRFFGEELTALELSLRLPKNKRFRVPLQQQHSHFIRLQTRWSNSLAPSARFTSRAKEALDRAIAYSGDPQDTVLNLASITVQDPAPEDEPVVPEVDDLDSQQLEPEQAALADILEGDVAGAEFDEDQNLMSNMCADIVWDSPEGLLIDDFRAPSQDSHVIVAGQVATRVRPSMGGFPQQVFEPRDISFLASPTAYLNDVCINGCAMLLQIDIPNPIVAIFSTHDLPRIRYNAADDILWRNTSWTRYWEKDVWIIPIHRPASVGHWVACVIYLSRKEIHLFDSLAERKPWKHDLKDIMKLVCRLLVVAHQRDKQVHIDLDGWVARPLTVKPLQTNGYDCGVWILAAMIAVLCGRHITRLQEEEMSDLRYYLRARVLSIPAF